MDKTPDYATLFTKVEETLVANFFGKNKDKVGLFLYYAGVSEFDAHAFICRYARTALGLDFSILTPQVLTTILDKMGGVLK